MKSLFLLVLLLLFPVISEGQVLYGTQITTQNAVNAVGNGTVVSVIGYASTNVDIIDTGVTSYTIINEILFVSGGTFRSTDCYSLPSGTTIVGGTGFSTLGGGSYRCNTNGAISFRTRISAIVHNSKTITIKVTPTSSAAVQPLGAGGGGADSLGTYLVQTSTNAPTNAQIMASLSTGLVFNTTTTGVQSIYTGTVGTGNQLLLSLNGSGVGTYTTSVYPTTNAIDTVLLATSANTLVASALSSCSGASNALIYNTTTHAFGCNSIAGGAALSGITAATGTNTIANGNNHSQIWNWALTTDAISAFTFGETTAATGGTSTSGVPNQILAKFNTLATSTASPLSVYSRGSYVFSVSPTTKQILSVSNAAGGSTSTPAYGFTDHSGTGIDTCCGGAQLQFYSQTTKTFYADNSHIAFNVPVYSAGTAPSVSACGTSPSINSLSTNANGIVTIGTGGVATSCTITFSGTWAAEPQCWATNEGAILVVRAIAAVGSVVIDAATPLTASGKLKYGCVSNE